MLTIITLTGSQFILRDGAAEYLNLPDDDSIVDLREMDQSIFFSQISDRMWTKIVEFCHTSLDHPEGTGIPSDRRKREACTDKVPPVDDHWWNIVADLSLNECIDEFNYWKMTHLVPGNNFDFANLWEMRTAYAIAFALHQVKDNKDELQSLLEKLQPLIEKDKAINGWS